MNYKQLKNIILKHNKLYYDSSAPEISDSEWDQLYDKLGAIEKAQGWKDHDSPTNVVGGAAGKVAHPHKLYSLQKVYDKNEVDDWMDIETPKIDGTNLSLIYTNGKLNLALTRGNGEHGTEVTHLVEFLKNAPARIDTDFAEVVVNGECVTDNEVENFRNYVSGALGLDDPLEFEKRNINFVAHDWLGVEMDYMQRMAILKNMGFLTALDEQAKKYPTDGIVYRCNSYKKSQKLGYTSKYPKFAVALKTAGTLTATTTLQEVVWTIGRTGAINPTGIVEPVVLDDATISRVTLHNMDFIEEHNLGLGDIITIERAGGVIPKFINVIEHSKHNMKINQKHAELAIGQEVVRDGPRIMTKSGQGDSVKFLEYFIRTMQIKGLGPASIAKMGFTHPVDLYQNPNWSILGANGVKVQEEIERTKTKPYQTVLAALGIEGVGNGGAKLIVPHIPTFRNLRDIEYAEIKGVGPRTKESILAWLDENEEWVHTLPLQLEQEITVEDVSQNIKKVCITGKLDMTRNQLVSILEPLGFKSTSTVTKDCYALIAGDSGSSKHTRAAKLGVTIVDYWSSKKDVLSGNF